MDWTAIWLSIRLATATALVLLVIGVPIAWWLSVTKWRLKFLVEAVVALPLVLPPTVLGFYVLVALGPRGPVGSAFAAVTGGTLAFSFTGLLMASVLYSLPFAVQPFAAAFGAVDLRLSEASWTLGLSRAATFARVVLPLAWPGVLAGLVLSFAHTLGEFGVVLMVGGSLPGETRTIAIAIYDQAQAFNDSAAAAMSALLLALSFIAVALVSRLGRSLGRR